MSRRALLVLPLALLLPACMATTENAQNLASVPVVQPSDAHLTLHPAEGGGAAGELVLTYADETQRNFRPKILPNGVSIKRQSVRALWCGARPDCGIREERLTITLSAEAIARSARDGLTLILAADPVTPHWLPFMSDAQRPRHEMIVLPAYQIRHTLRRGGIRF